MTFSSSPFFPSQGPISQEEIRRFLPQIFQSTVVFGRCNLDFSFAP